MSYETERNKAARDAAQWCRCAGPTCSGCEANTTKVFNEGADWAHARAKVLVEALEWYETAFDKKLTGSMMGELTPFLADRGARAKAALKAWRGE